MGLIKQGPGVSTVFCQGQNCIFDSQLASFNRCICVNMFSQRFIPYSSSSSSQKIPPFFAFLSELSDLHACQSDLLRKQICLGWLTISLSLSKCIFFSKSLFSGPGYEIIVKCEGAAVSGCRKSPSNELMHPWPPALRSKAQRAHWLHNANAMTYNRVFQRKQNESVSEHEYWVMYVNPCQTTNGVTRPELKGVVASNLFLESPECQ